jgi:hypothetical protein
MAYTIVWHEAGISTITFAKTFLSLLGRLEQSGFAQKAVLAKKKYTRVVHRALSWRCHPCNNGIVTIINAQASLPLL